MENNHVKLEIPSKQTEISIHFVGDVHLGASGCDKERFKAKVKEIASDKNAYWIDMGDDCDCITTDDPRFSMSAYPSNAKLSDFVVENQAKEYIRITKPIASQCIGKHLGNHEAKFTKHKNFDVHQYIIEANNLRSLAYCALTKLFFIIKGGTAFTTTIFSHHGAGGATTTAGALNKVEKFIFSHKADIYLMAHTHQLATKEYPRLGTQETYSEHAKIVERPQILLLTGGYLRTYQQGVTGYGEVKGYQPIKLGSPKITFNREQHNKIDQYVMRVVA